MNHRWMTIAAGCSLLICTSVASAQPGSRGMHPDSGELWEGFSTRHDLDGDGGVSAEEFAASDTRFESLDHNGDGIVTRYSHNKENLVEPGDLVRKGEPIALVGATGRATGSHVHFEVYKHGRSVDPLSYVRRTRR